MAQDFWAASGFRDLRATPAGLVATPAWFARFLEGDELAPPGDAGPRERALHARVASDPFAAVDAADLAAVEDADARENWSAFLDFRERVRGLGTLEACYRDLYTRPAVDLAPPFVDALVQALLRACLDGTDDAFACRAAEMLFRRQRVSTEDGRVLAADAKTIEVFAETGGFGSMGKLLRQQGTATADVKMDVMTAENAPLYFLRDALHGFVLDVTPGSRGAGALADVLVRWIARMEGVAVTITALSRIDDARWRWHVGLDVDASAILDALYRGEAVGEDVLARLLVLFRLEFAAGTPVREDARGRPVWLGLACRPDRTLKVKPQNLLLNLPLAGTPRPHA